MAAVALLAVASIACSITINLPTENVNVGSTQTEEILVPQIDTTESVDVSISFGAGELSIEPGAEDALIMGTAVYNVEDFKPNVSVSGNDVRLETGELEIKGIPNFSRNYKNEWDLKLGDQAMDLTVNAGAYQGRYDFGGLALNSLRISDGAAQVEVDFSAPNPEDMDSFRYDTGFSTVELRDLANSNAEQVIFKSGAGEYTLDFSGELQRDMDVTVDTGFSSVKIIVPTGVPARVTFEGGFSNVDLRGDWEKSGSEYTNPGDGPQITINIQAGAGNLELSNR
jgi:hypothetical protein